MAKARKSRAGKKSARRNPVSSNKKRARRARRNPIGVMRGSGFVPNAVNAVVGAAIGAAGGLAVDLLIRPLPLQLKTGPISYGVRGLAAIAVGAVGAAIKQPLLLDFSKGALTVTAYNAMRQYVALPMGLGEMSDDDVAQLADAYGDGSDLGAYAGGPQLGLYAPGATLDDVTAEDMADAEEVYG